MYSLLFKSLLTGLYCSIAHKGSVFDAGISCVLVCVLATQPQTQLPANNLEKVAEDGPCTWAYSTGVENLEEAPGPWL